jgi:integrase
MAHISKYQIRDGIRYRAHVHRKGHPLLTKGGFQYEQDAKRWALEQERNISLAGLPLTIDDLKRVTVEDIVRRYLKDITPQKGCAVSESTVLNKFLRERDLSKKSLAFVTKQDAWKYIDDRLKETWRGKPITPRTVRRELNTIQHVFEIAKERWGYTNLVNPFRGVEIKGSMHRRKRRLNPGELEKLEGACKGCVGLNRFYVPLAIYLAIETGMRLQEIFNLTWRDINIDKRRVEIRKSKTDNTSEYQGRTIVLSIMAGMCFNWLGGHLNLSLGEDGHYNSKNRVFSMTKNAFKQSWSDVLKRAGIEDLTFHDLRREAGSRFDEAGLTKAEHDLMMGHVNGDMASLYIHSDLKVIQEKLDRLFDKLDKIPGMGLYPWTTLGSGSFFITKGADSGSLVVTKDGGEHTSLVNMTDALRRNLEATKPKSR